MSSTTADSIIPANNLEETTFEGEKSKNQLKNEAKRAEKMAKFTAKQAKLAQTGLSKKDSAASKKTLPKLELPMISNTTPEGEKKDMNQPMADAFNPRIVESSWYSWWEAQGFFRPEYGSIEGVEDTRPVFTIMMPPPNVTGSLHVGHAMMGAIEDALARWHRMKGHAVLYLPGCDHAGISTQVVVEKQLAREQGKSRLDLGREAFVAEVWKWKNRYGDRIYKQLKRLGVSADWGRAAFTLDSNLEKAVSETFVRLFEDGLITRANRLVNWCGRLQTAVSDLEVVMREIPGRTRLPAYAHDSKKTYEFGVLTALAYKLEGADLPEDEIVIETTRPETVFADVAVCVHPDDKRYERFHGKKVIHPITGGLIPIICDKAADPEFGTGALKVSPAHDATDFVLAQQHNLPFIVCLDENNRMSDICGSKFAKMMRYDAREAVVEMAKSNGTFRGDRDHVMNLPTCERTGDFIEPRLVPQWWLNCSEMAQRACEAVRNGDLSISPPEHERIWFHWLENIRDWCLSRQLWWGHRIPAYQVKVRKADGSIYLPDGETAPTWIAARSLSEAIERATAKFPNLNQESLILEQDEDVLDTWFSSGLWPFSTLGWPDKTADMARFYPNSLLETGSDIIFFWVARMVMMGLQLTNQIPFSRIFLHAIVRDAHGRKMSKSLGNVIDPIDVIEGISLEDLQKQLLAGNLDAAEVKKAADGQRRDFPQGIPECGTDALRFTLCSYVAGGNDVNLDIKRVEGYRKFCNKLWNACRFALTALGSDYIPEGKIGRLGDESLADRWILHRLNHASRSINSSMESVSLMAATTSIHNFWLHELCDVYIEVIKPICRPEYTQESARRCARNTLYICLEAGLQMLHPFMPFVTEELYQRLPRRPNDTIPSICVSPFPPPREEFENSADEARFGELFDLVKAIRSMAVEQKLPKGSTVSLIPSDSSTSSLLYDHELAISSMIRGIGSLSISNNTSEKDAFEIGKNVKVHFAPKHQSMN